MIVERCDTLELSEAASPELRTWVRWRNTNMESLNYRYEHVADRIYDRFEIDLSYDDFEELNYLLFKGEVFSYVDTGSTTETSLYMAKIGKQFVLLAYSEETCLCMTVFPRNDTRRRNYLSNSYMANPTTSQDRWFFHVREQVAANYDPVAPRSMKELVQDAESFVSTMITRPTPVAPTPIQGFVPKVVHSADEVVTPTTSSPPSPVDEVAAVAVPLRAAVDTSDAVVMKFVTLSGRIEAIIADLPSEAEAREIRELEARLALLRSRVIPEAVKQAAQGARSMASLAFEQMRDGILDRDSALVIVNMLDNRLNVAEGAAPAAVEPEPVPAAPATVQKTQSSLQTPRVTKAMRADRDAKIIARYRELRHQSQVGREFGMSQVNVGRILKKYNEPLI